MVMVIIIIIMIAWVIIIIIIIIIILIIAWVIMMIIMTIKRSRINSKIGSKFWSNWSTKNKIDVIWKKKEYWRIVGDVNISNSVIIDVRDSLGWINNAKT